MKKTSLIALACAALLSSSDVQAEPKFIFRYVSGGANLSVSQPQEPVEPETPEDPMFNPDLVFLQNLSANYIPAAGNTSGEVAPGDTIRIAFDLKNEGDVPIDSMNVTVSGGTTTQMSSCAGRKIPAHSIISCIDSLSVTQKEIDIFAPGNFTAGVDVDGVTVNGIQEYIWLNDWRKVILPQNFNINKHIRVVGKKAVWNDVNKNGVLDVGDYLGVNFFVYNDHPTVSLGYIGVDKYFGVLDRFSQSGISKLEAGGYYADGSSIIVNQSTLDKFPKGLNAVNGAVLLKTEFGNISFSTDNTLEFMVQ